MGLAKLFSRAVEGGPAEPGEPFEACKVTFTAQEWCGHVFEEVQLRDDVYPRGSEQLLRTRCKAEWRINRPAGFVSEDHLRRDNDGGEGHLLASVRLPYWQLKAARDEVYREQLKMP